MIQVVGSLTNQGTEGHISMIEVRGEQKPSISPNAKSIETVNHRCQRTIDQVAQIILINALMTDACS